MGLSTSTLSNKIAKWSIYRKDRCNGSTQSTKWFCCRAVLLSHLHTTQQNKVIWRPCFKPLKCHIYSVACCFYIHQWLVLKFKWRIVIVLGSKMMMASSSIRLLERLYNNCTEFWQQWELQWIELKYSAYNYTTEVHSSSSSSRSTCSPDRADEVNQGKKVPRLGLR